MKPFSLLDKILSKQERRKLQYVGINKMLKPRGNFTSLERKYYSMLQDLKVCYITQYQLDGRIFDAFLPDHNILIEFDGAFWHPTNINECKYGFQKKSMEVDKIKNEIAKKRGHRLIRIREDEPITTDQLRKLLKG